MKAYDEACKYFYYWKIINSDQDISSENNQYYVYS